jgi:nucleotide-binding universal stress UspA family protein
MKILLAVDGSKGSLAAADWILKYAAACREAPAVELVTVHLPVPKLPNMGKIVTKAQIESFYRDEGEAALAMAKKKLELGKIAFAPHVLVGPVAETIVEHARDARCDLICMGNRGMTELGQMLLGSTATKVLHLSPKPVLLAK